jgi:hypothetical protein
MSWIPCSSVETSILGSFRISSYFSNKVTLYDTEYCVWTWNHVVHLHLLPSRVFVELVSNSVREHEEKEEGEDEPFLQHLIYVSFTLST